MPEGRKRARVTPVLVKDKREDPGKNSQHAFTKRKSFLTNLMAFYNRMGPTGTH